MQFISDLSKVFQIHREFDSYFGASDTRTGESIVPFIFLQQSELWLKVKIRAGSLDAEDADREKDLK